jgi:AraC-like DNA-binding protein
VWTGQHLHEALSVAQLAQQVFLSPSRFAERCRRETGLSVMQWLRSQRLALAIQLREGGMGVADTAQRCGYQSPSALTAALRRFRFH